MFSLLGWFEVKKGAEVVKFILECVSVVSRPMRVQETSLVNSMDSLVSDGLV